MGNPEYMAEAMEVTGGLRGVPIIVIGQDYVRGFDKERLNQLLGLGA